MSTTRSILYGLSVAALCLVARSAKATTRHVPADYPTIQAAIDAAATDDDVLVDPGTYFENLDTHSKRLALKSTAGSSATIVDGRFLGRVVVMTGGGLLEGFTIQRGYHESQGGGIYSSGGSQTTMIRNNVIRNNSVGSPDQGDGGGIFLSASNTVVVEGNQIMNNYAGGEGGGLWAQGTFHFVRNNTFENNRADIGGGAVSINLTSFTGNLVRSNQAASFGAGILVDGATVEHNTIVSNVSGRGAGIYFIDGGIGRHNAIANNVGPGIDWNCSIPRFECNDLWANAAPVSPCVPDTVGGRNFSADPLFCDPASSNYRISAASPCAPSGPSSCGLIGAFDVGCGVVPTRRETWGTVKVRYR